MIWTLFLIWGQINPQLNRLADYRDQTQCEQAMERLNKVKVPAVCLPIDRAPTNKH